MEEEREREGGGVSSPPAPDCLCSLTMSSASKTFPVIRWPGSNDDEVV